MQKAIYLNDDGTKIAGFSAPTESPRDIKMMISELGVDSNVLEGITEIKTFRDLANEAIREFERTADPEPAEGSQP